MPLPCFYTPVQRFVPYLLDRLLDAAPDGAEQRMLTLDELERSVARDVEALLNTRCGLRTVDLQDFPNARRSVVAFGLEDFASRSLASTEDREHLCRAIARAIADHEPRLSNVDVKVHPGDAARRTLRFAIRAMLQVHPLQEPVAFNAELQPTTQHYAVAPTRLPQEGAR